MDPFSEHTDAECLEVLERCHLASLLATSSGGSVSSLTLDTPIGQTGSLSAGERQLVALARAVLRRSNVVIMDEATSQIDTALDDQVRAFLVIQHVPVHPTDILLVLPCVGQIQRTIREEFAGSIVITIAHRLKTVLDYDRILVLGNGDVLEFDTPEALINKPGGVFREMCRASADWVTLQTLARRNTLSNETAL